ncbi:hypothetical protein [Streptomyces sp. WG7]|uniref:hypothetical protein n=1 Tax=Streptomyces sp. WG7 TaxID=3417650 RepID=UPI003CF4442E
MPEIRARPARPAPVADLLLPPGRTVRRPGAVVERSGLSLGKVGQPRVLFPQARFVHLYRSGPDCALSMSRHIAFRMIPMMLEIAERCGVDSPYELTAEHFAQVPPDPAPLLTGTYDPALIMDRPIPFPVFGDMWLRWIVDGVRNLEELPAGIRTSLSYEDLLAEPREELTRPAGFIGVEARPDWLEAAAGLLDGDGRRGSAGLLDPAEPEALRQSCAEGTAALAGAAGRPWARRPSRRIPGLSSRRAGRGARAPRRGRRGRDSPGV